MGKEETTKPKQLTAGVEPKAEKAAESAKEVAKTAKSKTVVKVKTVEANSEPKQATKKAEEAKKPAKVEKAADEKQSSTSKAADAKPKTATAKAPAKTVTKASAKTTATKPSAKTPAKPTPKIPAKMSTAKTAPKKTGKTMKIDVVDVAAEERAKRAAEKKAADKKSTKTKEENMKLPTVRRIHFKVGHVILTVLVVAMVIFFGRVAIWEQQYLERMEGSERDTTEIFIEGEEDHDEVEPTTEEVVEYHVAPGMPRFFSIPSVGINQRRVVQVGLLSNNQLATPYNIWNIGWYSGSAKPGDAGVSVIDAHGGAHGVAAFGNLPEVKIGDKVYVEMEPLEGETQGVTHVYQIVDTATKQLGAEADEYMSTMAFASPAGDTPSMTMITCTGVYYQASRTYSQRFFARAILVEESAVETD